jgi:hypothetical protein
MVVEADRLNGLPPASYSRFHYYAATATVTDEMLLGIEPIKQGPRRERPQKTCRLGKHLQDRLGIQFTRTIANDEQLVDAIVAELELRGLRPDFLPGMKDPEDPDTDLDDKEIYPRVCRPVGGGHPSAPSHVAVIGEWDTLYARSLRVPLRAIKKTEGFCVDRFSYLRGLDGALPSSVEADKGAQPAKRSGDADKKDGDRRKDGTFIERAEGQSQFDYLRRLAKLMSERDKELRRTSADGKGLRAIGVIGSDINDKLLVLQALQPEFPDALFFTTDLDARYLDPREQAWTRNLIVASSYGLRLDSELQEGTPPFRDSYQTAVFFTTRLLLDDAQGAMLGRTSDDRPNSACPAERSARWSQERLNNWLKEPRIFEIGRTRAFDFQGRAPLVLPDPSVASIFQRMMPAAVATAAPTDVAKYSPPPCRGEDWLTSCLDIHPTGSMKAPAVNLWGRWLVCALLLSLWVPFAVTSLGGVRPFVAALNPPFAPRTLGLAIAATLVLLQVVIVPFAMARAWPAFADWLTSRGEPLDFTEGISLWPTEAIRLFALLLGSYLLLRGWRKLADNQKGITASYSLEQERSGIAHDQQEAEPRLGLATRLWNMVRLDGVAPRTLRAFGRSELPFEVAKIWQRHVVQSRLGARVVRVAACVLLTLLITVVLTKALGELRFVPARGAVSFTVHEALHALVFLMLYLLVFFVLDAALLCVSFIHLLREQCRMWPAETIHSFEDKLGFAHQGLLDHWIDLQCLAERTRSINGLIYYPFILLSLVLLSRSDVFDDWTMPLSGKVLAVVGALFALCGPVALRTAVERSRTAALRDLDMALIQVSSGKTQAAAAPTDRPGPPSLRQLELLKERIVRLDGGAFAPYSQQPLLKALVLPFATIGGTSLLELLRMANL